MPFGQEFATFPAILSTATHSTDPNRTSQDLKDPKPETQHLRTSALPASPVRGVEQPAPPLVTCAPSVRPVTGIEAALNLAQIAAAKVKVIPQVSFLKGFFMDL